VERRTWRSRNCEKRRPREGFIVVREKMETGCCGREVLKEVERLLLVIGMTVLWRIVRRLRVRVRVWRVWEREVRRWCAG